ncbi:MAG: aminoacetone oxidase family FAD-binding enzyme [Coprococcus sp.]
MIYDVLIVGGGAAGMTAAIYAAKKLNKSDSSVLLIEKNKKLGRKLYATGNGKCNLANSVLDLSCYDSNQEFFPYEIIDMDSCHQVCDFMRELGVDTTNKDGYMYPSSMQASSVVWAMTDKLKDLNVIIHLKEEYISANCNNGLYNIVTDTNNYIARNLILAPGGAASPKLGGTSDIYNGKANLDLKMYKPYPALCKLSTIEDISLLSGVRVKATAVMYTNDIEYAKENGELQFTSDGLSGIMIFNLSCNAGRLIADNIRLKINISLLPDKSENNIIDFLTSARSTCPDRKIQGVLNGLINEKLAEYILGKCRIGKNKMSELDDGDIHRLSHEIKNMEFHIKECGSFEEAQVTSGGIDTTCISPINCEVYGHKGLFVIGEYLDVTGKCGGYNIMWAIITGMKAGNGVNYDSNK